MKQINPTRMHSLPVAHFDKLARGGGDPQTISLLLDGEYSRRLLLLRALLDRAAQRRAALGPLPPANAVWHAFARLDEQPESAAALRDVLMHPQFGMWLSRAVRLLNDLASSEAPTWVEIGQIHAATFAAAIRAGVPLSTHLPLWHGQVLLPTLGMARLPTGQAWGVVRAEATERGAVLYAEGHRVVLPADLRAGDAHWWPLRRLEVAADDRTLSVWLDDIDPYRDLADPVPPQRLDGPAFQRWASLLEEAWRILCRDCPTTADAIHAGLTSIAPLPDGDGLETRSASTGDAFGAALISRPHDAVTLAVSLVHEFQHIKLGGLLHLVTLYRDGDEKACLYAPWRDDPRPLPGLIQGVYAFLGIAEFWRRYRSVQSERERQLANFEFAYARRQTREGLRTVLRSPLLTELGRRFALGMASRLRGQMSDRVATDADRAAWAAAAEHRAAWRLRHLQPDPVRVTDLAEAFLAGRDRLPAARVPRVLRPTGGAMWYRSRLALHRTRLAAPDRFEAMLAGRDRNRPDDPAATADLALVGGDPVTAEAGYQTAITADPDDIDGWTGLGLALAATGAAKGWRPLAQRPELVRATYVAIRNRGLSASPVAVAEWFERTATR